MFTQDALMAETGKLQKFSMKLTRNKSNAEDLFQSTCLRALEKAHYFQDGTNLFGWTSKIMYHLFVTDYRRKMRFETQYDPENYLSQVSSPQSQEAYAELAHVKRAMMKLKEDHRQIIALVCIKGMHYVEVSKLLQIPVGTVRSRLSRAREQLQAILNTPTPQVTMQTVTLERQINENMPIVLAYMAAYALKRA